MNEALRSCNRSKSAPFEPFLRLLISALQKLPTRSNPVLQREIEPRLLRSCSRPIVWWSVSRTASAVLALETLAYMCRDGTTSPPPPAPPPSPSLLTLDCRRRATLSLCCYSAVHALHCEVCCNEVTSGRKGCCIGSKDLVFVVLFDDYKAEEAASSALFASKNAHSTGHS